MISASFLRAIYCTKKLHCSSGKRLLLLPQVPPNKACFRTWPCLRWGLLGQREVVWQPRRILKVTQKAIWTQGNRPLKSEEDGSKQVSVQKSQRGGPALSTSQRGGLFYVIFKELFSSSSPSKIYGKALEKCRSHPEVISVFGDSIKGYGETTRRGRRQHVSHIEYVKDGLKYMRLKFYIEGSEPGKQGTVHLEMKENPESGKYEFRYIFVDVDVYPRRTIVIEDNRSLDN
ncbi:mitochondrial import inner membrane translocase subunit Tim21 isoform X4 [Monodelphis domestica]|uniref:mitochondrial import inner membrane translocase subunit Tim21 isoform X4 n=1 Tax=Monodelphis domestica TaxID=13616 RepID=UPI0024E1D04A|nr:mitochondrial import inner membrane translocase subunit Tim21 isoform X4 [Monodelphis domestica]